MKLLIDFFYNLSVAQRRKSIIILFQIIFAAILETASIGFIIPIIAVLLQNNIASKYPMMVSFFSGFGHLTQTQIIQVVVLSFLCLFLLKTILVAYFNWQQSAFGNDVQFQLSRRLFAMYIRQPYTFHLQRNSAQLINNITLEVTQVQGVINSLLSILSEAFIVLMVCVLLIAIQPLGSVIIMFIFIGASWAYSYVSNKYFKRWGEMRQFHSVQLTQHLMQGLGSVKDVKLLGKEENFIKKFLTNQAKVFRVIKLNSFSSTIPRQLLELLSIICLVSLILLMLLLGKSSDTILYTIGLFAMAAFRLIPSLTRIITYGQSLKFSVVSVKLVNEELKLEKHAQAVSEESGRDNRMPLNKKILLKNIQFSYPQASEMALKDITVSFEKGQSIGIIGPSGSGKSTLIDLIIGLLVPESGVIQVDGKDIHTNDISIRGWQNNIGYVPQTIYLTDDSIRNNVAIGVDDDEIDDQAIQNAIKFAQLDQFVAGLPNGLDTFVGERGVRLSGGQRQRIGIARALYHNPEVIVLDEATSALDTLTEQEVMQSVKMLKNKTILIVAHRYSTLEHCNTIICLESGKIIRQGVPEEILPTRKSS